MSKFWFSSLSGAVLALSLLASTGFAGVVTYTDPAVWNGSVDSSSLFTVTFDCATCTVGPKSSFTTNTDGAVFTGSGSGFTGVNWLNFPSYGGAVLVGGPAQGSTPSMLNVALPSNVSAFSVQLALASGVTGTVTVTADGVVLGSVPTVSSPVFTFFGATTTGTFSNLSFATTNSQLIIDNVSFGSAAATGGGTLNDGGSAVPDPATFVLAGSGLALVLASRRFSGAVAE